MNKKSLIEGKRLTLILDDDLRKKLLQMQSEIIIKTKKSYSFSRMVNKVLRDTLESN